MLFANAAGRSIACEWHNQAASGKPDLVFLHEGLGSIRQWRDFPAKIAAASGRRALVYDRYGYGQSDILREARRTIRFMHDEGLSALPELLKNLEIVNPVLIGHSDGASIALIHAGAGHAVSGVVAMAPHVFIEPICLSAIENAKQDFASTELPQRLGRYHRDVKKTFYGWADVWTEGNFKSWDIRTEYLANIRAPVLAIQGEQDEYGTMQQLDEIARHVPAPCELLKVPDCGHTPFRDQPEKIAEAVLRFLA